MERVTEALQRARAELAGESAPLRPVTPLRDAGPDSRSRQDGGVAGHFRRDAAGSPLAADPRFPLVRLDEAALEQNRVVANDSSSPLTRYYDMLRNQLLSNKEGMVGTIAVTSPTAGCGVTVTAINLAFSLARMRTTNVLLVDANPSDAGVAAKLRLWDRLTTSDAPDGIIRAEAGEVCVYIVTAPGTAGEVVDHHRLSELVESARKAVRPALVVLDLPPMLANDETIPSALDADRLVLVLAVGESTVADLEACKTFLGSKAGVQVVLNKTRWHDL